MKKIFCITCHKISVPLKLTTDYLSSFPENIIIIHVDKKTNIDPFRRDLSPGIIYLNDRVDITWGTVSQIKAFINLLKEAVNFNPDYIFMLSGDDLLCMTNKNINATLRNIDYKNLIHYQDDRNPWIDPVIRVKYKYPDYFYARNASVFCRAKKKLMLKFNLLNTNDAFFKYRHLIHSFYKGTNWFGINNKTLEKIIRFLNDNHWYYDMYRHSLCGDEVFFHTLLKHLNVTDIYHNTTMINDALRYIDWTTGPEYPRMLNEKDIEQIKKSGCIFARKFSDDINQEHFSYLLSVD